MPDLDVRGPVVVRAMEDADAEAVLAIYRAGIEEGDATFETAVPGWDAFVAARPAAFRHVAVDAAGTVLGWVAASPVSSRPCYAGVLEHSVYVHPGARGRHVGRLLLDALVAASEANGVWTLQSSVFPENAASAALHQAAGFRVVGRRERIAQQHGCWRDTLLVERRSEVTGPAAG